MLKFPRGFEQLVAERKQSFTFFPPSPQLSAARYSLAPESQNKGIEKRRAKLQLFKYTRDGPYRPRRR